MTTKTTKSTLWKRKPMKTFLLRSFVCSLGNSVELIDCDSADDSRSSSFKSSSSSISNSAKVFRKSLDGLFWNWIKKICDIASWRPLLFQIAVTFAMNSRLRAHGHMHDPVSFETCDKVTSLLLFATKEELKFDLVTCLFSRIDWRQSNSKKSYSQGQFHSFWCQKS